jgi:rod shape-determining protein MreD
MKPFFWRAFIRNSLFPALIITAALLPVLLHLGRLNLVYSVLFFWIMANPQRIRFGFLFGISLLQDLLNHTYLGVHCSLYAIFMIFLLSQLRQLVNRGFLLTWVAFSVSLFTLMAVKSFLSFMIYHQILTLYEFIIEDFLPILLFPLVYQACAYLYIKVFPKHA